MNRTRVVAVLLAILSAGAYAQDESVEWSATGPKKALKPGEKFEITLSAKISDGWHMYSFTQPPGGPTKATASLPRAQPFKQADAIRQPEPHRVFDPNFEMQTESYEGSVSFALPVVVSAKATSITKAVAVDVRYQVCSESTCLPAKTVHLSEPVAIAASRSAPPQGALEQIDVASAAARQTVAAEELAVSTQEKPNSQTATRADRSPVSRRPFRSFLWLAAVMGVLSLLTPCVFPMIPITVSYFTNHASGNRKGAVFTAIMFSVGIILTFTALGMVLAVIFGAGGVNQLATNPWVNLLITGIFLGFAFSLFGAYFIQIPPSLLDRLNSVTRSREGNQVVGALLMGFTFTLTSFTCTAPFVGTLLVMTAQGNWRWPLAGMLAFSTVFAIPFFLLAFAPQLMSQLPKAGGWMNSVKVVMGFLEIAAAMKFLSNVDLVWQWGIFTRQVVLAVWVGIGVLTVLYVLGYFGVEQGSSMRVVRLIVAMMFLGSRSGSFPAYLADNWANWNRFFLLKWALRAPPPRPAWPRLRTCATRLAGS